MTGIAEMVDALGDALGEADRDRRGGLLRQCFAEDGVFVSPPTGVVRGGEALSAVIGDLQTHLPGARLVRTTGIDEHHRRLRFQWQAMGAGESAVLDCIEAVGELDDRGRICRMTLFIGHLPERT